MKPDKREMDELFQLTDSHASLSELAERLKTNYLEINERFDQQTGQLEDINTQLVNALETNNRLSAYLKNILESLDVGIVVFGQDGLIYLFNKSAERLTGVPRTQAIGGCYREIFDSEEHSPTFGVLENAEARVRGEKWYDTQPVGYSASKIIDDSGNCHGVIEILYDIAAEKKLRETIRQVSALAALGEMSAIVAHQVRNPLAGVVGFADLLARDLPATHPSANLVQKISMGAREVNRIITNLLDFTRNTKPDFRELDLVKFIKDTISTVEGEPFAANLDIALDSKIESLSYSFDPLLFRQVFNNILENASQAMEPEGGKIKVSLKLEGKKVIKIVFADSGKGFSAEDADMLFKPFFTKRRNGTGLGLAMVKKVVDFHNGVIMAESPPNGGAIFTIELPL
jgi:PAS domain S-box-containing protein